MAEGTLFPLPEEEPGKAQPQTRRQQARVVRPDRQQVRLETRSLDAVLAADHPARTVWDFLERVELEGFYASIKAVLDRPGRPGTDPRVLLALWLWGTCQGVSSARQIDRLCREHDAYRWLAGGVPINYHMLSDFRSAREQALDDLLTQLIAVLMHKGLVSLEAVAQDGLRVRASAGRASFKGRAGLEACLEQAQEQVRRMAEAREHPDPLVNARQRQARERAKRERLERVEAALALLPEMEGLKERERQKRGSSRAVSEARISTTDPEAGMMRMADGGFRPGYNVQLVTDSQHGVILAVDVRSAGSDGGLALPLQQQVEKRTGRMPRAYLMDGGYVSRSDITHLERQGISVYAPLRRRGEPAGRPREGDSQEVKDWRHRMSTEAGQATYKLRAQTAEWTNAQVRGHGVGTSFNLRGIAKVTSFMLLVAIAHNLMRWIRLTSI